MISIDIRRFVSLVLLAAAVTVPAMTRVHQPLTDGRNPIQEHSRFRWTDSCDSVPKKAPLPAVVLVRPSAGVVFAGTVDRSYVARPSGAAPRELFVASSQGLRAPPFPTL